MAKEFLARILTIENSVTFESSQDCIICQEKCGTLSPETGIMELEVRLPCSHTVGSACIAKWLATNNTCPLCRRPFFPQQPRPYMEHEIMQETEDEGPAHDQRRQSESDDDYLTRLTRSSESHNNPLAFALRLAHQLGLSLHAAFLALNIADSADSLTRLEHCSVNSIAAASVYLASHILSQPRGLADIARLTAVSERAIQIVYTIIYSVRYELIDEDWRGIVGGATLGAAAEALPSLAWPPLDHEFIIDGEGDDEERVEGTHDGRPSAIGGLELVKELCFEFQGPGDRANFVWLIAQKIAERMDGMALDWKTTNPWTIAAACSYMASYLVFNNTTLAEIGEAAGIDPALVRNTYEAMYGVREQIVQEIWFGAFAWDKEDAVMCLPAP
ncbi:MAG: hypothetical protein ASARMPREDX12_007057 [Alectoria sarmentosa]|nr:MAG: hypothetical protein ASARMPREDX12_007057 [Alectoria sarmentosa]